MIVISNAATGHIFLSVFSLEFKLLSSDNMWIKTDKRISGLLQLSSHTLFYPSATLLSLTRSEFGDLF